MKTKGRTLYRINFVLTAAFIIISFGLTTSKAQPNETIRGITIENADRYNREFNSATCQILHPGRRNDLNKLLDRIDGLGTPGVTVRVVFQPDTSPLSYKCILTEFKRRNYQVMGLIFDSDALARYDFINDSPAPVDCTGYDDTQHDYKARVKCYVETLNSKVDVWEAGNEVNGEWADKGCVKDRHDNCISNITEGKDKNNRPAISKPDASKVVEKIKYAIDQTEPTGKPIALTLIHQPDCTSWNGYEMFDWFDRVAPLLPRIKYLLVSYYEDNCNDGNYYACDGISFNHPPLESPKTYGEVKYNYCSQTRAEPTTDTEKLRKIYWNVVFENLHRRAAEFNPNIKIGFGEVGCKKKHCDSRIDFLSRYYSIRATNSSTNPATIQSWFAGGYFWWTAQPDILSSNGFYQALLNQIRGLNNP